MNRLPKSYSILPKIILLFYGFSPGSYSKNQHNLGYKGHGKLSYLAPSRDSSDGDKRSNMMMIYYPNGGWTVTIANLEEFKMNSQLDLKLLSLASLPGFLIFFP
jgi:hypothetical protein